MTINEMQDEVIAEFSDFDDWMDRYQLLIDLGNEQQPLDEKYKTDQNLIEGCQSRVWLGGKRRPDCERHHRPAHQSPLRPHTRRDTWCRPLLHRPHRPEGSPFAYP